MANSRNAGGRDEYSAMERPNTDIGNRYLACNPKEPTRGSAGSRVLSAPELFQFGSQRMPVISVQLTFPFFLGLQLCLQGVSIS